MFQELPVPGILKTYVRLVELVPMKSCALKEVTKHCS